MENTIKNQINTLKETYNDLKIGQDYDHGVEFLLEGHSIYIYNEGRGWSYDLQSNISGRSIEENYDLTFEELEEELENFAL